MEKKKLLSLKEVITGFRDLRNGISFRRRTNKKKYAADDGRLTIQKFHSDLREAVKSRRRRVNSTQDVKCGRWTPKNRYNIDQVPLPFVVDQRGFCKIKDMISR